MELVPAGFRLVWAGICQFGLAQLARIRAAWIFIAQSFNIQRSNSRSCCVIVSHSNSFQVGLFDSMGVSTVGQDGAVGSLLSKGANGFESR